MHSAYTQVEGPGGRASIGTGWIPPLPDMRDYTIDHPEIAKMAKGLGYSPKIATVVKKLASAPPKKDLKMYMGNPFFLPPDTDLRKDCSPIENQGGLGSCTAQAAVGIVEYFEKRAFKKHIDGSRLFVYKTSRNLMGVTGDTGAYTRTAMGALVLCGCPPEKYWPYTDRDPEFDREPSPFVYAVADNYEALKYFCHDPQGASKPTPLVLFLVKLYLAMGIPAMFGFYGFKYGHYEGNTYVMPYDNGEIPYPCPGDHAVWGHAVVAVGYDDKRIIKNDECSTKTKGALLIRNSWGTNWGDHGYGWIPYDFVINGLALDFWSLLKMEWVDTKKFGL